VIKTSKVPCNGIRDWCPVISWQRWGFREWRKETNKGEKDSKWSYIGREHKKTAQIRNLATEGGLSKLRMGSRGSPA